MKKARILLVAVALVLGLAIAPHLFTLHAQQSTTATQVQHDPLHNDSAKYYAFSQTSAATITLNPGNTGHIFIWSIRVQNCAGASAVTAAAPTNVTSTNLVDQSGNTAQWGPIGSGTTAGACQAPLIEDYPTGLKNQTQGTKVTIILPTFATNQTVGVGVAYSAP